MFFIKFKPDMQLKYLTLVGMIFSKRPAIANTNISLHENLLTRKTR